MSRLAFFAGTRVFLRQPLRMIILLGVVLPQCGCWQGVTREVLATVLSVEGSATLGDETGRNFIPLRPAAHAGAGKMIETSGSSRVSIVLLPNILVQLGPNTRLEIMRIAVAKDGNETGNAMLGRYADVKLLSGRMFVSHGWGEATAKFTVVTAHGELVTTSNSLFCIESDEKKTRVTCASGTVGFRARKSDETTRIPPGFLGEWPSVDSSIIAAETDAHGQEDLQEALEVEQKLRGSMSRMR
jgi:hypothetical protein